MPFLKHASLIASLFLSVSINGRAAATADILWGVNGHPFTAYPGISMDQQLDYVKDLGMTSYRVNITSAASAPLLAALVSKAKARDIAILPVITPALNLDKSSPQELYRAAYDLATALVSRFKNDIRIWELGNELENYAIIKACEMQDDGVRYNCDWGPAGGTGILHYYGPRWAKVSAVLKGLSEGTIAVDPTIRKAIGTAGWGHSGAFLRMLEDGIKWDISVWHHYEGDPEEALKFLARLGRPIWVTEFNHPRGSEEGDDAQADGLTKMMGYLRKYQHTYNVQAAHIYELMDEPYWGLSFEAVMGLVRVIQDGQGSWKPGTPKPAYHAAKQFIAGENVMPRASTSRTPPVPGHFVGRQCDPTSFNQRDTTPANQVAYSFCLVLGRPVDAVGNQTYVSAISQGQTIVRVLEELLNSNEFDARYGASALSNPAYVTLLYRLLLHREPDGNGLRSYVSQLDTGSLSRTALQTELVQSNEFQHHQPILRSNHSRTQ